MTPGGGKSSLPVIFGLRAIVLGIATKICWVVPRDSLKKQAAAAFADPRFRELLGHRMEIRDADNNEDPSRGSFGYATTYHAVGADPSLHLRKFKRHRYVLVLDELHHCIITRQTRLAPAASRPNTTRTHGNLDLPIAGRTAAPLLNGKRFTSGSLAIPPEGSGTGAGRKTTGLLPRSSNRQNWLGRLESGE